MSMSAVSDMLFEKFMAKAPKNQQTLPPLQSASAHHTSSGIGGQISPTSAETPHVPSTIAAIATNGAELITASKNSMGDEMSIKSTAAAAAADTASFHPRIKFTNKAASVADATTFLKAAASKCIQPNEMPANTPVMPTLTAIPTSGLVQPVTTGSTVAIAPQMKLADDEEIDVKPVIHPITGLVIIPNPSTTATASVIKPVPAILPVNLAASMLRTGIHNFQMQNTQDILNRHQNARPIVGVSADGGGVGGGADALPTTSTNILENFWRHQQRLAVAAASGTDNALNTNNANNDNDDDEDGDDSHNNGCFEDITLSKTQPGGSVGMPATDYFSDESQKFVIAAQVQAQALRNLEYSLGGGGGDYRGANNDMNSDGSVIEGLLDADGEPIYECRHCGKKYRWKSTLRRHENVECGGKEPSHQCPYCPYKSKQRGNLGVHVRKHHSNLPQLASKRRSKYSVKVEAASSDDSSSKLVIDCPPMNNGGQLNESQLQETKHNETT